MLKQLSIIGATALISLSAQADIIKCSFTEPFINTEYSTTQSTLTIINGPLEETEVIKNVSFQIKSAGEFELVSKEGKVLQRLFLNFKGSDGMSDNIYPYDVQDYKWTGDSKHALYGGCSSNYLKTKIVEP